jgi:hypothetical protein
MREIAIALFMIGHAHQVRGGSGALWIDAYRHWAVGIGRLHCHQLYWFLQHRP